MLGYSFVMKNKNVKKEHSILHLQKYIGPLNNEHTGRSFVHCREVVSLSLSQRLLMYNGHTGGGGVGILSTIERLSLSQMYYCMHG